jgi:transcriptional regulator with XRE-family HTH domain
MPISFVKTRTQKAAKGATVGQRIREIRKAKRLTLDDVSAAGGLSRAAVSKVELATMSPTYDSLLKIARGLKTDVSELIRGQSAAIGGVDVTRAGEGAAHHADKRFPSRLLAPNLLERKMHAFVTEVRPVPIESYGPWDSHDTEDFLFVIDGVIEVHLHDRGPVLLGPGDALQMDGRIEHALVAQPPNNAERKQQVAHLLWVSVSRT